jgi:hypothetical protein
MLAPAYRSRATQLWPRLKQELIEAVWGENRVRPRVARIRRRLGSATFSLPTEPRPSTPTSDVVHTHLKRAATMFVLEWWTPTHELRRIERE